MCCNNHDHAIPEAMRSTYCYPFTSAWRDRELFGLRQITSVRWNRLTFFNSFGAQSVGGHLEIPRGDGRLCSQRSAKYEGRPILIIMLIQSAFSHFLATKILTCYRALLSLFLLFF